MATNPSVRPPQPLPSAARMPSRAAIVTSYDGLSRVREPGIETALWTRALPDFVERESARFADERRDFRAHGELVPAQPESFDALLAEMPEGQLRTFLQRDLVHLAATFAALVERRHVHGALQVVDKDMCRKLHADNVPLRLLCTYAGPSTEWVDGADVHAEHLARADVSLAEANRLVLGGDWSKLRHATTGDVLLLKGYAGHDERNGGVVRAAVHRSPPVEAQGLRRLLLKLDVYPCGC